MLGSDHLEKEVYSMQPPVDIRESIVLVPVDDVSVVSKNRSDVPSPLLRSLPATLQHVLPQHIQRDSSKLFNILGGATAKPKAKGKVVSTQIKTSEFTKGHQKNTDFS